MLFTSIVNFASSDQAESHAVRDAKLVWALLLQRGTSKGVDAGAVFSRAAGPVVCSGPELAQSQRHTQFAESDKGSTRCASACCVGTQRVERTVHYEFDEVSAECYS